jgi:hypothetical protein
MWMVLVCPAAFAAPIALQLRKLGRPNGYLNGQLLAGFMFLGAGVSCFLLRIWKIRQQDETEIESVHHNAALRPYDERTPITALPMSQLAFHDDSTIRGKCLDSLHLSFSLRKVWGGEWAGHTSVQSGWPIQPDKRYLRYARKPNRTQLAFPYPRTNCIERQTCHDASYLP